jgi:4-hydroxy-3-methylbut-2-enyl diphosphate reductase IspH
MQIFFKICYNPVTGDFMDQIIELKNNRKLTIIEQHGYCFGVKRALNIVYETIENKDIKRPIYLLGNLIHNKIVTNKLTELGFKVIINLR